MEARNNIREIAEMLALRDLIRKYPTGILSVVSDTFNLWDVLKCNGTLAFLKDEILARDGKLVIRPDSGNPADIICGRELFGKDADQPNALSIQKGVIELLWDIFGGTVNEQGYKVLDPHIGCIYGDGIGLHNLEEINSRLEAKGFATTNWVAGFGSYGYQYNTRDTFGFAMKATYGEVEVELPEDEHFKGMKDKLDCREIFKDPITDDGTKKSAKGLLQVSRNSEGSLILKDQCTWEEEKDSLLTTVFKDSKLVKETTFTEIRNRLNSQL